MGACTYIHKWDHTQWRLICPFIFFGGFFFSFTVSFKYFTNSRACWNYEKKTLHIFYALEQLDRIELTKGWVDASHMLGNKQSKKRLPKVCISESHVYQTHVSISPINMVIGFQGQHLGSLFNYTFCSKIMTTLTILKNYSIYFICKIE